ncbi:MAG: hypothetical protein M3R26_02340 [Actinomycetota bacterium]|nr:hypothetical protein [Actinomycetota bacterium]
MSHFLVIYDRRRQAAPTVEEIADHKEAQERLFEIESQLRLDPDRGVVLLVADREEDLRKTHAQYFEHLDELTGRLVPT